MSRLYRLLGVDSPATHPQDARRFPRDDLISYRGCNKYRFNTHEFGDIAGTPRLLDIGQCNDSYSAVQIALALANAFDCGVIDLPLSLFVSWFEQMVTAPPRKHQAEIKCLGRVADGVMDVKLALVADAGDSASADFESGQFVRITVPGTDARRAYSPANVANWDGQLEFYIRLLPGGVMSEYLTRDAAVGDVLTVSSASGTFALAENGLRPRWFIAGGTGLSPLLSMLRRMAEWGEWPPPRCHWSTNRRTCTCADHRRWSTPTRR